MALAWNDAYLVGDAAIDRQHKGIFEMANALLTAIRSSASNEAAADAAEELFDYVKGHFADEEQFWTKAGAFGIREHAAEHRMLEREVMSLYDDIVGGMVDDAAAELERWMERRLIPHILEHDVTMLAGLRK
ncbi:MAG: bacteriohemerythrin [Actinomycetota bacterium]